MEKLECAGWRNASMGRRAFCIFNLLVVVLSLLTGLKVVPCPGIVGMTLAFYSLFLLPGILLGRLCFDSTEVSLEGICVTFFSGLVLVSLIVCLSFFPRVSFPVLALAAAGADIILLGLDLRRRRIEPDGGFFSNGSFGSRSVEGGSGRRRSLKAAVVLLFFTFVFVFFYGNAETGWNTDAPDHLSFIRRAVDSGEIFPHDSFHKDGDGTAFDSRKGLWHPVMSLWMYQSGARPTYFWSMVPSFFAFFAMISFAFFASILLSSTFYAVLAFVFLILFYRGESINWFTRLGYSRNIAQVVLWADISFLLLYYMRSDYRYLVYACALALIGVSFHAGFFLLFTTMLAGLLLYVNFTGWGREWRKRFWLGLPFLAMAAAIPLSIRAAFTFSGYNYIHTHLQGMLMLPGQLVVVDPIEVISRNDLMFFIALPLAVYAFFSRISRKQCFMVGILFFVPVFLVLNPVTCTLLEKWLGYMVYRLLYAAPVMCLLAISLGSLIRVVFSKEARGTGEKQARSVRRAVPGYGNGSGYLHRGRKNTVWTGTAKRGIALCVLILFILFPVRLGTRSLAIRARNIWLGAGNMEREYLEIAEKLESTLPNHSVVFSDPKTSYIISAHTDHFTVITLGQHCSPSDSTVVTRHKAVRDVLSPAVSVFESGHWLKLFGVDYILINSDPDTEAFFYRPVQYGALSLTLEKLRSCGHIFKEIYSDGVFFLFKVELDSPGSGNFIECDEPLASVLPCKDDPDSTAEVSSGNTFGVAVVDVRNEAPVEEMENRSVRQKPEYSLVGGFEQVCGCGVMLENVKLSGKVFRPGDTLSGSFCWRAGMELPFKSPIAWTVRMDTDTPQGALFRPWYSKQYRRIIERRNGVRYRFTRFGRLMSGCTYPDQWEKGSHVRQDFAFALPGDLAPGRYEVRLKVRKIPFLPNTTISDYLTDDDSFKGELIGVLWIDEHVIEDTKD